MKIAIVNQPTGNRGDEAAHKALVRRLADTLPDVQIDVLFIQQNQKRVDAINVNLHNVGYINVKSIYYLVLSIIHWSFRFNVLFLSYLHPLLWKFRRCLKHYDLVICAPGGMCMGGFKNWMHIWTLETARRMCKPIYYWGRSIGPFFENDNDSKIFKKNSIKLLKYFSYISLRDSISIKYAEELGVKVEDVIDSAFLECPDASIPEYICKKIGINDYIVYVPNELTWHPRYPKHFQPKIDGFFLKIFELISNQYPNCKIVMLPQTYKSTINDYTYFQRLSMMVRNKNIIVIDENQNSDIQQKIISGAKLVIGARYHSIVFAINNNVPFISLSYEHKMKGLLEKLNLTEYMIEIQDIFSNENDLKYNFAIKQIEDVLKNRHFYEKNNKIQELLIQKFDYMVNRIRKWVKNNY